MKTLIASIALLIITALPLTAEDTTTRELLNYCQADLKQDYFGPIFCSGYITGLMEMRSFMVGLFALTKPNDPGFDWGYGCMPNGVTLEQVTKVFIKYANDHPELLHKDASIILLAAFKQAFPCTNKDSKK